MMARAPDVNTQYESTKKRVVLLNSVTFTTMSYLSLAYGIAVPVGGDGDDNHTVRMSLDSHCWILHRTD